MVRTLTYLVLAFMLMQIALAFVFNESLIDEYENKLKENKLELVETRRQIKHKKKSKSTSSSGQTRNDRDQNTASGASESLQQSISDGSSSESDDIKPRKKSKDRTPQSSAERRGWRKWHRKCTKCPDDMNKKWRDPTIKWICGAYQRARRTFKSLCMMHYRNCQDGTMFTKIADRRCPNSSGQVRPYNLHFFYDYKVTLTNEQSDSGTDRSSGSPPESSSWDTDRLAKLPPLRLR